MKVPCSKPQLNQYSPHQENMLLLDQVDTYDLNRVCLSASLEVKKSSEFFQAAQGGIPTWVSFEYMAQCIAILAGIRRQEAKPEIGFIISIRDFQARYAGYQLGAKVKIRVQQIYREDLVASFEGFTLIEGVEYSCAVLNVIEKNQELLERWGLSNE